MINETPSKQLPYSQNQKYCFPALESWYKTLKIYENVDTQSAIKSLKVEYFVRIHRTSSATMQIWILRRVI